MHKGGEAPKKKICIFSLLAKFYKDGPQS